MLPKQLAYLTYFLLKYTSHKAQWSHSWPSFFLQNRNSLDYWIILRTENCFDLLKTEQKIACNLERQHKSCPDSDEWTSAQLCSIRKKIQFVLRGCKHFAHQDISHTFLLLLKRTFIQMKSYFSIIFKINKVCFIVWNFSKKFLDNIRKCLPKAMFCQQKPAT